MALRKGIVLMAITDHDTVGGLEEAEERVSSLSSDQKGTDESVLSLSSGHEGTGEQQFHFIPGIEISTQDTEEIHILGYGIDRSNAELVEACRIWSEARTNRGDVIRDYLAAKNVSINLDEVKAYAEGGNLGRPHFARYLIEHGYVNNRKEAFSRYLDTPEFREATDRKKPSCEEAIRLIHLAGGKAVMAHPGIYRMNDSMLEALISRLAASGLDGVECFYGKHTKAQTDRYLEWIRKYGLKTSCGSDFHGETVKPGVEMGMKYDFDRYGELITTEDISLDETS